VNGSVTATGTVTGEVVNATTSFDVAGTPFAFGSLACSSVFFGLAGNPAGTIFCNLDAPGGHNNTASGYFALHSITVGWDNTASGSFALSSNTTGILNTASGVSALLGNTTGDSNTASGYFSHSSNSAGTNNTASGVGALGTNETGSFLTCIGSNCNTSLDGLTNATAIGANAVVGQSNALVLGSINGVNNATSTTNVGIGTTTPSNVFTIGQGAGQAVADGWATYSSRRWKTNIHTLHGALATVEQLRGVSYDLKVNGKHEVGVIAEEVGAVVLRLLAELSQLGASEPVKCFGISGGC
jgi:hypothetical protein